MWTQFFGYLTADGLNYLLGFAIYGWLIRILSDRQYGYLSVATSIYQVLMMVTALGLDLIGPRLITDAGGNASHLAQRGRNIRLATALLVCGPVTVIVAALYWRHGQFEVATVVIAGFAMVLARAFDVTYLAVALGAPGALARTRALGLGLFLATLFACKRIVPSYVWIVPLINAAGVTIGRCQLMRMLRKTAIGRVVAPGLPTPTKYIVKQGAKAGSGQLLLFIFQGMDIVLLAKYVSAESLGQYAMVSKLYLFGTAVLACLLNTYMPSLINVAHDAEAFGRLFRKFVTTSLWIGVAGAGVFWLAAPFTCELLGHRHLPVVHRISPLFALLFLIMAICNPFLSFLPSLHRSGTYLVGICAGTVVLVAGDLILMPRLGPSGAAIGQLIATSFLALFMARTYWIYVRDLRKTLPVLPLGARGECGKA
ncbi:MAG: lipopolysaccharide biosynthesis protein [Acidobacteriaceae bacterium]